MRMFQAFRKNYKSSRSRKGLAESRVQACFRVPRPTNWDPSAYYLPQVGVRAIHFPMAALSSLDAGEKNTRGVSWDIVSSVAIPNRQRWFISIGGAVSPCIIQYPYCSCQSRPLAPEHRVETVIHDDHR